MVFRSVSVISFSLVSFANNFSNDFFFFFASSLVPLETAEQGDVDWNQKV